MKIKALFLTPAALLIASFLVSCSTGELKSQSVEEKKAEVYYTQGTSELINKNYTLALTHLLQAKELNPKDSRIRNNLGMAYFFREQSALAEKELKEAIDLDSKNSDAKLNLGSLYLSKNQLKQAREQFEKVELDLTFTNQFRNYYNLAMVSLKEGDRRSAFDYLARSIKEKSDYCPAHFKRGELYSEEYKFKQALEAFRESSKGTCVTDPAPHYQQAMTLINLSRPTEAKMKFQEIREKFPTTRYSSLAAVQIKKIENSNEQSTTRANQTEVIPESESVETPNF